MNYSKAIWMSAGAALVMAGCGGGSDYTAPYVPTLSGVAATGSSIPGAAVTAKCVAGDPVSGITAADGTFSLELKGGQGVPCMLQVVNPRDGSQLFSYAAAVGRINVTTQTDVIIRSALGSEPASTFAAFNSGAGTAIANGLAAGKTSAAALLTGIGCTPTSADPLTVEFSAKAGDVNDAVLDCIKTKLAEKKTTLSILQGLAVGKAGSQAALAALAIGAQRGDLIDTPVVVGELPTQLIDSVAAGNLPDIPGKAACGVKLVPLYYKTIGVNGEAADSSGVLLVPTGTNAACTGPRPLLAYAHGTKVDKGTLAGYTSETILLGVTYAAQGYVVAATDYLGYGKSTYSYHPYVHAESEASAVLDSIRAARNASAALGFTLSGKVMFSGYSQGGHSSMAAHRAAERDNPSEFNVVAGAHLAGPYNLSGQLKETTPVLGVQFFYPLLLTSWQKIYHNMYSLVTDAFKAPYALGVTVDGVTIGIEDLLPSSVYTYDTLTSKGVLPGKNGESAQAITDLLMNSAYVADARTNPLNALYLATKRNELLGWSPKAKTLLCGGADDPTVPPAIHMVKMKADFDSRKLTNVTTVDVDSLIKAKTYTAEKPYNVANYHGGYEPPLCTLEARKFFDSVLAGG